MSNSDNNEPTVERVAHHIAVTTCLSPQQARIAASAAAAFFAEREKVVGELLRAAIKVVDELNTRHIASLADWEKFEATIAVAKAAGIGGSHD